MPVSRWLPSASAAAHDHAVWQRDFLGASGLFAMVLHPVGKQALHALFDALELFGIGRSWGGFKSLALRMDSPARTVRPWAFGGPLIRNHAARVCCDDLIRDLARGLDAMARQA